MQSIRKRLAHGQREIIEFLSVYFHTELRKEKRKDSLTLLAIGNRCLGSSDTIQLDKSHEQHL